MQIWHARLFIPCCLAMEENLSYFYLPLSPRQWQSGTMKEAERNPCCSSGQPAAFPTTLLTHPSFTFFLFFFLPPSASDPSRQTTLTNKGPHFTPKSGREPTLLTVFWWQLHAAVLWAPVTWSKRTAESSELLSGGARRLFRGSDKMEQLLHTFVFMADERFAKFLPPCLCLKVSEAVPVFLFDFIVSFEM